MLWGGCRAQGHFCIQLFVSCAVALNGSILRMCAFFITSGIVYHPDPENCKKNFCILAGAWDCGPTVGSPHLFGDASPV